MWRVPAAGVWFAVALSTCAASEFQANDRAETIVPTDLYEIEIPIRGFGERILIPVSVNGQDELEFILDSSSPATVLFGHPGTKAVPMALGRELQVAVGGAGLPFRARIVESLDIAVGPIEIRGLRGALVEREDAPFPFGDPANFADGILGYDLFSRFVVEIDAQHGVLVLRKPKDYVPDPWAVALPLQIHKRKPYSQIDVKVRHDDFLPFEPNALVDLGHGGQLELTVGSNPSIRLPLKRVKASGAAAPGQDKTWIARIDRVLLGEHRFDDLLVEFVEPAPGRLTETARLGAGILNRFRTVIDYTGRRLLLSALPGTFAAFEWDMSGLRLAPKQGGLTVSEVLPNSPAADAGFRKNDRITRIDDTPADKLDLTTAIERLRAGDGRTVVICRRGDGVDDCKTIRLRRRI